MSLIRKLRKLRRDPARFFRDLVNKRLRSSNGEVADRIEAARAELRGHERPLIIAYLPVATENPYQRLLYCSAAVEGAAAVPVRRLRDLVAADCDVDTVCHLHWLTDFLRSAASDADARRSIAEFASQLDRLKQSGASIVWTVHNLLPHSATRRELERELRRALIARADAIHVMSARTRDEAQSLYDLPTDKLFLCPHPTYDGAYPDTVQREEAREALGLPGDTTVFLAFGSIQQYKGLPELIAAFERVDANAMLVIAGIPTDATLCDALRRDCRDRDGIRLFPERIPDNRVQLFFRSADYVVCAHRTVLNSGAAALALTFGVPVVGPNRGAIGELIEAGGGIGFDPCDSIDMIDAMRQAAAGDPARFSSALASAHARAQPPLLSRRFFRVLRHRLGY